MSERNYSPVTPEIIELLGGIVGARNVIVDPEKMEQYSHDETAGAEYRRMPEVVVKPETAEEVSLIMKLASDRRIPVTPRGAGSGLAAGAVPVFGGIVLATDRMNRIIEIDAENMMVVVEPGVVTNDINEFVAAYGLFYAGYPMSLETCYIGGNIATNAGGGRAIKYGVTERYVLGLQLVTPTGEILDLGGKRLKDATGYNLVKLIVGSEGTLGVVTRITLRLMPMPRARVDLLAIFPDAASATRAVPLIMTSGGVTPMSLEFMDKQSVRTACEYLNETLPWRESGAMLLIELDGSDEKALERDYDAAGEICLANGASEVFVADNRTTRERLWSVRRNIPEAFNAIATEQGREDVVVPPSAIPQVVDTVEKIARDLGIYAPCFGHAGDGNLHIWLVRGEDMPLDAWREKLERAQEILYREVKRLGGTLSGEHGIGAKRKGHIGLFLGEAEIEIMRRIKRAFDPENIMNPGKIFDNV